MLCVWGEGEVGWYWCFPAVGAGAFRGLSHHKVNTSGEQNESEPMTTCFQAAISPICLCQLIAVIYSWINQGAAAQSSQWLGVHRTALPLRILFASYLRMHYLPMLLEAVCLKWHYMWMKKVTVSMELTSSPSDFFFLINALLLLFFWCG